MFVPLSLSRSNIDPHTVEPANRLVKNALSRHPEGGQADGGFEVRPVMA